MSQPGQPPPAARAPIAAGTDISVDLDADDLEDPAPPATSDPEEMNEDEALGGVGGGQPGGAG